MFEHWAEDLSSSALDYPLILTRLPPNRVIVALWFEFWTYDCQQQYKAAIKCQLSLKPDETLQAYLHRYHALTMALQQPDAVTCANLFQAIYHMYPVRAPEKNESYDTYRRFLEARSYHYGQQRSFSSPQQASLGVAVNNVSAPAVSSAPLPVSVNVTQTRAVAPAAPSRLEDEFQRLKARINQFEQSLQHRTQQPSREPPQKRNRQERPSPADKHSAAAPDGAPFCTFCNVEGHTLGACRSIQNALQLGLVQKPSAEKFKEARGKTKVDVAPAQPASEPSAKPPDMAPPPANPRDGNRGRGRGRGNRGRP